jgi:hypothetical protein
MVTTTKQPTSSKPQPPANPDPVATAEATLAALERDRAVLVAARTQDDAEMQKHAYAARVQHELGAIHALSEISGRTLEHDQRLREIDAALVTARSVLKEAQAAEAREAERARAVQMRVQIGRLRAAGQTADDALSIVVEAAGDIHKAVDQIHALGFGSPNHQQVLSLGERAIRTAIGKTPWSRCVERVAPNERMAFAYIVEQWATMIERRLGEQPNKERAA